MDDAFGLSVFCVASLGTEFTCCYSCRELEEGDQLFHGYCTWCIRGAEERREEWSRVDRRGGGRSGEEREVERREGRGVERRGGERRGEEERGEE